jgi:hypothetical protein
MNTFCTCILYTLFALSISALMSGVFILGNIYINYVLFDITYENEIVRYLINNYLLVIVHAIILLSLVHCFTKSKYKIKLCEMICRIFFTLLGLIYIIIGTGYLEYLFFNKEHEYDIFSVNSFLASFCSLVRILLFICCWMTVHIGILIVCRKEKI